MIKFIQMYSDGKGDYTQERQKIIKEATEEDFEKFLKNKWSESIDKTEK